MGQAIVDFAKEKNTEIQRQLLEKEPSAVSLPGLCTRNIWAGGSSRPVVFPVFPIGKKSGNSGKGDDAILVSASCQLRI
jgi:hypothetical protein